MSRDYSALKQDMVALEVEFNDKSNRFLQGYLSVPPSMHHRTMVKIYLYITIVSILSSAIVLSSEIIVLRENSAAKEKLVRVDGVVIQEHKDLRRDILLQNTKERARLGQGEKSNIKNVKDATSENIVEKSAEAKSNGK